MPIKLALKHQSDKRNGSDHCFFSIEMTPLQSPRSAWFRSITLNPHLFTPYNFLCIHKPLLSSHTNGESVSSCLCVRVSNAMKWCLIHSLSNTSRLATELRTWKNTHTHTQLHIHVFHVAPMYETYSKMRMRGKKKEWVKKEIPTRGKMMRSNSLLHWNIWETGRIVFYFILFCSVAPRIHPVPSPYSLSILLLWRRFCIPTQLYQGFLTFWHGILKFALFCVRVGCTEGWTIFTQCQRILTLKITSGNFTYLTPHSLRTFAFVFCFCFNQSN